MITVRNNVFETNSSSCHSITYIRERDFEALRDEEVLVRGLELEVAEHVTITNKIVHEQLLSLEEAVELYKRDIEKAKSLPDGEDEWEVDFVIDMKHIFPKYWGVDLLRYIFFKGDIPSEFDEMAKSIARYTDFTDYIFFLEDWLGIYLSSYKSLFERDNEARIEFNRRRSIGRNPVRKISTIISC